MAYSKDDFTGARFSKPAEPSTSSSSAADGENTTPTGVKPADYTNTLRGRGAHTEFADPCAVAREESMKCLNDNAYDKAKCTDFFMAYRDCKKTWLEQRREDRRAGKDVA
ncbi:hypothetical protein JCM11641_004458 [Rhodosporidiobolus odoratus]